MPVVLHGSDSPLYGCFVQRSAGDTEIWGGSLKIHAQTHTLLRRRGEERKCASSGKWASEQALEESEKCVKLEGATWLCRVPGRMWRNAGTAWMIHGSGGGGCSGIEVSASRREHRIVQCCYNAGTKQKNTRQGGQSPEAKHTQSLTQNHMEKDYQDRSRIQVSTITRTMTLIRWWLSSCPCCAWQCFSSSGSTTSSTSYNHA